MSHLDKKWISHGQIIIDDSHGRDHEIIPGCPPVYGVIIEKLACGKLPPTLMGKCEPENLGKIPQWRDSHGGLDEMLMDGKGYPLTMVTKIMCTPSEIVWESVRTLWPMGTRVLKKWDSGWSCCPGKGLIIRYNYVQFPPGTIWEKYKTTDHKCCEAISKEDKSLEEGDFEGGTWGALLELKDDLTPICDKPSMLFKQEFDSHGGLDIWESEKYKPLILYPLTGLSCSTKECVPSQPTRRKWYLKSRQEKLTTPAVVFLCKEKSSITVCCECCEDESSSSDSESDSSSSSSSSDDACPTEPCDADKVAVDCCPLDYDCNSQTPARNCLPKTLVCNVQARGTDGIKCAEVTFNVIYDGTDSWDGTGTLDCDATCSGDVDISVELFCSACGDGVWHMKWTSGGESGDCDESGWDDPPKECCPLNFVAEDCGGELKVSNCCEGLSPGCLESVLTFEFTE